MLDDLRIGFGYDIHKFIKGNGFNLGGVFIIADFGVEANSDGDVVIHSLMDAILGALAKGDIGLHFPQNEPRWKNSSSKDLLSIVLSKYSNFIEKIINVDITIKLEKPKIAKYREEMRTTIAEFLNINDDRVNIKIKSGEGIGNIGRCEAIEAYTAVLIGIKNGR
jgi:2-C-methyl-D-erythritol 2,4-cyclodiphosphate synthase